MLIRGKKGNGGLTMEFKLALVGRIAAILFVFYILILPALVLPLAVDLAKALHAFACKTAKRLAKIIIGKSAKKGTERESKWES